MSSLLQPVVLGEDLPLANRITMAPMTRNRNLDDMKPTKASQTYYTQRATAGLIVSEGIMVSKSALQWQHVPVLYNASHVDAWRAVTSAVHDAGGRIFAQAWHAGRIQNEKQDWFEHDGSFEVLAPSPIQAAGGRFRGLDGTHLENTADVKAIEDPKTVVEEYKNSARLAREAGFDGVEVLALGGYLVHSFLNSRSNIRTDSYGGSVENRCRFTLEVVDAVSSVYGRRRTAIKIGPFDSYNDSVAPYEECVETYTYLVQQLVERELAYICLSRRMNVPFAGQRPDGFPLPEGTDPLAIFGPKIKFPGSKTLLMVNDGYAPAEAEQLAGAGKIDLISFGWLYITNPDLVQRIENGDPLATNNRGPSIIYGIPGAPEDGYTDWPCAQA